MIAVWWWACAGPRIADRAEVLPPEAEAEIGAALDGIEARTSAQVAVLTVPDLGGRSIEEVSLELANAAGLGRKGYDDGVLVLLAPTERQARIEVGLGLEQALTDAECAAILDERMIPRFRDGAYAEGLAAGVRAIGDEIAAGPAAP